MKETKFNQNNFTKKYTYNKTRISSLSNTVLDMNLGTNHYTYDALGRINSDTYSSKKTTSKYKTYKYDEYGQLVRENNEGLDKTFVYVYDDIGNITSVKEYAYTLSDTPSGAYTEKTYTYNSTHADRLTKFNGKYISYTQKGELFSYDGRTYSWSKGRLSRIYQGASMQPGKYENMQFTYNALGQRVSKYYTYNKNTADLDAERYTYNTNYAYDSLGRLIYEKCTETQNGKDSTLELTYLYDQNEIIGVIYEQGSVVQTYYYIRNLSGDVVGISDTSGNIKVEYQYDAYGNCKVTNNTLGTFANYNPIRYRGYYLDRETGFYFLNTRYYNPEWRRFISPDSTDYLDTENVNGLNLFAYCGNDPVNYSDPTGHFAISLTLLGLIIGAVVGHQ